FMDTDYLCDKLVPQDDFYRKFKEAVTPLLKDEDFADMYCAGNGRPGIPPSVMACAVILQKLRNFSDRDMEDACAWNIRIKHALGIEIDGKLFDHSTIGKFRQRLLEHGREKQVFDTIVKHLVDIGLIKKDEMQRIDATHIVADIAVPTAIRLIRKCIFEIIKMLKTKRKDIYDTVANAIDIRDYDKKTINKEIPWEPEGRSFKNVLLKVVTEAKTVLGIVSGLELGESFAFAVDMWPCPEKLVQS
ncbi:MAG TPA: transposase, partial [Candidatus Goldiibacteriota bacterium]|nr:transposase [Candidatus Goldiibacteriota bacterium]